MTNELILLFNWFFFYLSSKLTVSYSRPLRTKFISVHEQQRHYCTQLI